MVGLCILFCKTYVHLSPVEAPNQCPLNQLNELMMFPIFSENMKLTLLECPGLLSPLPSTPTYRKDYLPRASYEFFKSVHVRNT